MMIIKKCLVLCLAMFVFGPLLSTVSAQGRAPREETLLNGLKVAIFSDTSAEKVTVRLRVNAGSAFDPQGKEGVMRILSESIFLSDEARQYFADDLDGSFEIVNNFDLIQITVTGRTDALFDILETLANAVTNPQINKETTDLAKLRVRNDLGKQLAQPAFIADRKASERLFGTFPYGRSVYGTNESLARIDFADIRFAYDRFFGADNAALTIHGNITGDTVYRAARRFFGSWLKSDRTIPSTFRQPDAPDTSLEVLNLGSDTGAEVRHVMRGFSKANMDFPASELATVILDRRLKDRVAGVSNARAMVRNESYVLPGQLVFAVSGIAPEAKVKLYPSGASVDAKGLLPALLAVPVSAAEFQAARNAVKLDWGRCGRDEAWLNAETYRLSSADFDAKKIDSITQQDVQKLIDELKKRPVVSLWMVKGLGSN